MRFDQSFYLLLMVVPTLAHTLLGSFDNLKESLRRRETSGTMVVLLLSFTKKNFLLIRYLSSKINATLVIFRK